MHQPTISVIEIHYTQAAAHILCILDLFAAWWRYAMIEQINAIYCTTYPILLIPLNFRVCTRQKKIANFFPILDFNLLWITEYLGFLST